MSARVTDEKLAELRAAIVGWTPLEPDLLLAAFDELADRRAGDEARDPADNCDMTYDACREELRRLRAEVAREKARADGAEASVAFERVTVAELRADLAAATTRVDDVEAEAAELRWDYQTMKTQRDEVMSGAVSRLRLELDAAKARADGLAGELAKLQAEQIPLAESERDCEAYIAQAIQLEKELAAAKAQSDDWQKRGWDLGKQVDELANQLHAATARADEAEREANYSNLTIRPGKMADGVVASEQRNDLVAALEKKVDNWLRACVEGYWEDERCRIAPVLDARDALRWFDRAGLPAPSGVKGGRT